MDGFEAARIVFSRIQKVMEEPESASKIIGLLLLKDHGEQEMIRLACCPESHLHSVILALKSDIPVSSPSQPSPSPFQRNPLSSLSSRLGIPSPLSIPDAPHGFSPGSGPPSDSSPPLARGGSGGDEGLIDESQMQDHLSFLNDGFASDVDPHHSFHNPIPANNHDFGSDADFPHRRSYSVSDVRLTPDLEPDSVGAAWKQCLYFTRGFCKNGTACRFLHAADLDGLHLEDSSLKAEIMEQRHQLLRSRSFNPHYARLAGASPFIPASPPTSPYLADKYVNFLLQNQLADSPRAAAAMVMRDEMSNIGQTMYERSHSHTNGGLDTVNPGSRQIYLTFPADSSFREEDVSNYFSIYGPVQDVRIPYQQKRMFGFVTFVYPETVKIILAKGNPHFVCDARVLVKPYKEKGKVPDRYSCRSLQPLNRGDYFMCNSPTGLGLGDHFDNQTVGPGMVNNQDIIWRRKLEEHADLQQALELQSQRLLGLRLQDVNRQRHQRALSMGGMGIPSPIHAGSFINRSFATSSASSSPESNDDTFYSPRNETPPTSDHEFHLVNHLSVGPSKEGNPSCNIGNLSVTGKDMSKNGDLQESVNPEQYLPDSPFASPGKVEDYSYTTAQNDSCIEGEKNNLCAANPAASYAYKNLTRSSSTLNPAVSTLEMAKSCYFQLPRLSASHGAIEM
ncbi:unnamed protein product [Rhodiola kirilowii]